MSGYWEAPDDYAEVQNTFSGSAHGVNTDRPNKDLAEEVARRPMPRPAPRRMGFLP